MAYLDSESPATALESIAEIYDADPNAIQRFFCNFDIWSCVALPTLASMVAGPQCLAKKLSMWSK
ncbi:MAG: hypothetical protein JSS57_02810 [Proteobacteria bacterium]|nr:hypothetical protein [Pseudomonadota bacterium]